MGWVFITATILLSWLQFVSNYLGPLIGNILQGPIYATRPIIFLKTECCGQNFNYKSTSSDKIPCSKGRCQSSFWSTDPKTLKFCMITDICSRFPGKNNGGNWTQSEWLVLWVCRVPGVCKLMPVHCRAGEIVPCRRPIAIESFFDHTVVLGDPP